MAAAGRLNWVAPSAPAAAVRHTWLMAAPGASPRQGLAKEFHTCDFHWDEWALQAAPIVARQEAAAAALPAEQRATAHQTQQRRNPPVEAQSPDASAESSGGGGAWDEFYSSVARSAKFFRERRYLLLEFPVLAQPGPLHVVELGCGYGASLLPILRHNPEAVVTGTDIAPTCLAQLHAVVQRAGIPDGAQRVTTFVCDSASPSAATRLFEGVGADVALIMFTLSAVPPDGQAAMLANAWAALRPGGCLCIRDHGLYDHVQLRIPPDQWVGPNMYRRGDGTLAYFFSLQDLCGKAQAAGFAVSEGKYITVVTRNRKTGVQMKRVFVHGVFVKPAGG